MKQMQCESPLDKNMLPRAYGGAAYDDDGASSGDNFGF